MAQNFSESLLQTATNVNTALKTLIPRVSGPEARVAEAMHYAVDGGGKRLRPFLLLHCARLLGLDMMLALRTACALECVHIYSLIHDDLPCMDDDDLRHGQPTLHKKYDEATAVLAGDAFLTLAFELLSDDATHESADIRIELVQILAAASGTSGMIGGQMLDLLAEQRPADIDGVSLMQQMKTGALIMAAADMAATLAGADDTTRSRLIHYTADLGLVFQIVDDILDVEGDAKVMGKAARKDDGRGKATFVSLLGLETAKSEAQRLAARAKSHLRPFGQNASVLSETVDFVLKRQS